MAWAGKNEPGFLIKAEIEGFFSPTIRKINISDVSPDSQAARAGMIPGDEITFVESHEVVGAKAEDMKKYLQFEPGETRILVLRHANGQSYTARITKPSG